MGRLRKAENADLPPRMLVRTQRSGRAHFYYATPGTKRREIPLGSNRSRALARYRAVFDVADGAPFPVPERTAEALHKSIVKNAKVKGRAVEITREDVRQMIDDSGGVCAVTGIPFDGRKDDTLRIRPWMPSIDRIDPAGPYSRSNTRVVCAAVNLAMNQFGEATFLRIAAAAVLRHRLFVERPEKTRSADDKQNRKTPEESGA